MRVEAWLFGITTVFLVLVTPAYWLITDAATQCNADPGVSCADWTGTSALVMTTLRMGLSTSMKRKLVRSWRKASAAGPRWERSTPSVTFRSRSLTSGTIARTGVSMSSSTSSTDRSLRSRFIRTNAPM